MRSHEKYIIMEREIGCAKECGYDYMEMRIDATDEKINRIFMDTAEKKKIMEAVFQAGLPIGSMSVSALTKYALGDPNEDPGMGYMVSRRH